MNTSVQQFIKTVKESMLLVPAQKREFLDQSELLPDEYRMKVIELLRGYDTRALKRNKTVDRLTQGINSKYSTI